MSIKLWYFGIVLLVCFCSCKNKGKINAQKYDYNTTDTLKIDYLKMNIIGHRLVPKKNKTDYERLRNGNLLLLFESDYKFYAFYNKEKSIKLLTSAYWSQLMFNHIFLKNKDSLIYYPRFVKVEYNDPYLTGFYSKSDSIIVGKGRLRKSELQLNYVYTNDSLLILDRTINIGSSANDVLNKLELSEDMILKDNFELVLMEATNQVSNAWYNSFPNLHSDFSSIVMMKFSDGHLQSINYLDGEYADYVFRNKTINTRDIHYQ